MQSQYAKLDCEMLSGELIFPEGSKVLIVSPHPDDAVLSLGGVLWGIRDSCELTMLTVFGLSKWALDVSCDASDWASISAQRAIEEQTYADNLACQLHICQFRDASLRGYSASSELGSVTDSPQFLMSCKKTLTEAICRLAPNVIFGPAAVGNHVDHQLTRETIHEYFPSNPKVSVVWYQDLPYAVSLKNDVAPHVESVAGSSLSSNEFNYPKTLTGLDLVELNVRIDRNLEMKMSHMAIYKSQLAAGIIERVAEHASIVGCGIACERLWVGENFIRRYVHHLS